jgi:type VII secretion-associated protein (TIGR03931 family)
MTEVVIEVGPGTIRGANAVRPEWAEWVCAALDCIDDEMALVDDHPVSVRDVWDDVMSAVAGEGVDTAVLVCPGWWSTARVDLARQAARTVATEVVVLERIAALREGISAETTIVEIASDVTVVTALGTIAAVVPRHGESAADAEAVVAAVGASARVLVDAPVALSGAELLASSIADRMRASGVPVQIPDDGWVRRAAAAQRSRGQSQAAEVAVAGAGRLRDRKAPAVLFGMLSAVVLCGAFAAARGSGSDRSADDLPMALLVEGRIGVMVPATWTAQRITSGPGSARVQVVSRTDGDIAVHITQSAVAQHYSLEETADTLFAALAESADGVFVDFNPSDRRADRDAVTYREVRPARHVAWTVLVEPTVRIAIGCQSVPGREHLVREACERAIRSAHAVL